jgi:chemotaxis protein CheX
MNKDIIEPFSITALKVFPELGFSDINLGSLSECGRQLNTPGVIVIIGVTGDLQGNVIFSMCEDCAKFLASTMMMGAPVEEFDEMAQSALGELGNMLAANSCIELVSKGFTADISTPTIMHGGISASASFEPVTKIEILISGHPFNIYVSLQPK